MKYLIAFALLSISISAFSQNYFGDRCLGTWGGTMYIYSHGTLRDSVKVKFEVAKSGKPNEWIWRTDYLSPTMPMVKNYLLRLVDESKGHYVTDERDGIVLHDYLVGNKLYSMFETEEIYLTSSYELRKDLLLFEVTSGRKLPDEKTGVRNFSVANVQRVVLTRQ
jgi:hypothetical protein